MTETKLFGDFDSVACAESMSGLFCHELAELFHVCVKDESLTHPVSYDDACKKLVRAVCNNLQALDKTGHLVKEFKLGLSYMSSKSRLSLRPDKPYTWSPDKGIAADWKELLDDNYNGIAVIACVNKNLVPTYIQDVVKLKTSDRQKQNQPCRIDHRFYAQGLLNATIQHFLFSEPDHRVRNSSLLCGKSDSEHSQAEVIYIAFKTEKAPEKKIVPFLEQQRSVDMTPGSDDLGDECLYRVLYPDQGMRKLVKIKKSNIGQLRTKLRAAFDLPSAAQVEYSLYMTEDEEWYECDEEDLPPRGKLRISVKQQRDTKASKNSETNNYTALKTAPSTAKDTVEKGSLSSGQLKSSLNKKPSAQQKASTVVKKAKKLIPHKHGTKKQTGKYSGVPPNQRQAQRQCAGARAASTQKRPLSTSAYSSSPPAKKTRLSDRSVKKITPVRKVKREVDHSPMTNGPVSHTVPSLQGTGEQILVKDLEPGLHRKKIVVMVSTMKEELKAKFLQLDCTFNMHFEDCTGDIFGFVQPESLYESLESGEMYEIRNFEVWKSPDNVYGLKIDGRTTVKAVGGSNRRRSFVVSSEENFDSGRRHEHHRGTDVKVKKNNVGWSVEIEKKLMEIHVEMKEKFEKSNWKFVSEQLGTGHTNEQCRKKFNSLKQIEEKERSSSSIDTSQSLETTEEVLPEMYDEGVTWMDKSGMVHQLIDIPKSDIPCQRKRCTYCLIRRRTTVGGYKIETRKKCRECNVPLCHTTAGSKNCFLQYHKQIKEASDATEDSVDMGDVGGIEGGGDGAQSDQGGAQGDQGGAQSDQGEGGIITEDVPRTSLAEADGDLYTGYIHVPYVAQSADSGDMFVNITDNVKDLYQSEDDIPSTQEGEKIIENEKHCFVNSEHVKKEPHHIDVKSIVDSENGAGS